MSGPLPRTAAAAAPDPDEDRVPQVRTLSLAEGAAVRIADEITSGSIRPGQRLPPERELALHLGLSRGALREGLRTLESVGLVTARVGQGRFVNDTGSDAPSIALNTLMQLQPSGDLLAVRGLLEPAAVRDMPAAQLAPTAARAAEILGRMRRAQARGRGRAGGSTSHRVPPAARQLRIHAADAFAPLEHDRGVVRVAACDPPRSAGFKYWITRHAEIVAALETGDIEEAAQRVLGHLQQPFSYPTSQ